MKVETDVQVLWDSAQAEFFTLQLYGYWRRNFLHDAATRLGMSGVSNPTGRAEELMCEMQKRGYLP